MEVLWSSTSPLTANEMRARLELESDRVIAPTTLLTVLARLERKRFVDRERARRPATFTARRTRAEHSAELMHEVLDRSSDRDAALARFVSTVDRSEAETLRRLLDTLAGR